MTSAILPTPSAAPAASVAPAAAPLVLVIYAYPSLTDGHGAQMLTTAKKVLDEAGARYTVLDLYRSGFQPVMPQSEVDNYGKSVPADVAAAQSQLRDADVWIFLYPVWWSAPPALFKGFIDRVFTPGFAFKYASGGSTPLLTNKRALIARTYGSSALQEQKIGNIAYGSMEKAVLEFCGVKSVSVDLYSIDTLPPTAFNHALFQLSGAVRRQLVTPTAVPHGLRTVSAPYLPPIERREGPSLIEEEAKPELSAEAQSDLEYFRNARKAAKEKIIGAPSGGRGDRGRGDRGRRDNRGGEFTGRNRNDDRTRGSQGGRDRGRGDRGRGRGDNRGPRGDRFASPAPASGQPAPSPLSSGFASTPHRDARPSNQPMRGNISYSGRGSEGSSFGGNRPPGSRPPMGGRGAFGGSPGGNRPPGDGSHQQRHRRRRR